MTKSLTACRLLHPSRLEIPLLDLERLVEPSSSNGVAWKPECLGFRTKTGVLIIDMINEFAFSDAAKLFPTIEQIAQNIAALKRHMK